MDTRETILAADDRAVVPVSAPGWVPDGTLYMRPLSARDRDSFEAMIFGDGGKRNTDNVRARLLVRCLCDETGRRIFADTDADALGQKSARITEPLFEKALTLNAFSKSDVEELAKN